MIYGDYPTEPPSIREDSIHHLGLLSVTANYGRFSSSLAENSNHNSGSMVSGTRHLQFHSMNNLEVVYLKSFHPPCDLPFE